MKRHVYGLLSAAVADPGDSTFRPTVLDRLAHPDSRGCRRGILFRVESHFDYMGWVCSRTTIARSDLWPFDLFQEPALEA